jgi:hypothetical protein
MWSNHNNRKTGQEANTITSASAVILLIEHQKSKCQLRKFPVITQKFRVNSRKLPVITRMLRVISRKLRVITRFFFRLPKWAHCTILSWLLLNFMKIIFPERVNEGVSSVQKKQNLHKTILKSKVLCEKRRNN